MSYKKIGIAAGVAGAAGAVIGGISNSDSRVEGALKGGLTGAGVVGGVGAGYKKLSTTLTGMGYNSSNSHSEAIMGEMGVAFRGLYDAANSQGGRTFTNSARNVKGASGNFSANVANDVLATSKSQTQITAGLDSAQMFQKQLDYMGRVGGAMDLNNQSVAKFIEAQNGSNMKAAAGLIGGAAKDMADFTYNYTVKPGNEFVKNVAKGNFKDLSMNQATSLASNAYMGVQGIGAIGAIANGDMDAAGSNFSNAMIANGLQMKGAALYSGVKSFYKSDMTMKGVYETLKFSKYSRNYNDVAMRNGIDNDAMIAKFNALPVN